MPGMRWQVSQQLLGMEHGLAIRGLQCHVHVVNVARFGCESSAFAIFYNILSKHVAHRKV